MSGFGNEFATEDRRCPGALPEGQVDIIGMFLYLRDTFTVQCCGTVAVVIGNTLDVVACL